MNKILILGHPQSGYQKVELVLQACGMQSSMPSQKERFTPFDISVTLCKAHGILPVQEIDSEEKVQQIDVGPVWNGLALDLLLGNLEQKLWGWSDPQALCLLDYWKNLDPKMTFVLVYDEPHRVLAETVCDESMSLTEAVVLQRLNSWNFYNGALLWFYLRNKSRCMLVNAQQVRNNAESCLKELQSYLDVPLALPEHYSGNGFSRIDNNHNGVGLYTEIQDSVMLSNALATDRYLIDRILETHPEHLQRYEEMQAVARVPLDAKARSYSEPLEAWLAQMKIRSERSKFVTILAEEKQKIETQLIEYGTQNEELREQLETQQKALEEEKQCIQRRLNAFQQQAGALKQEAVSISSAQKGLVEENELLLTQLHQVQEELEHYYIENQKLRQKNNNPAYYGAADRIKQQLSYRLGSVMIERSKSISGWFTMPGALLKERRAFHSEKAEAPQKKLPPVHRYCDAQEAEKVKKHLSYRLGSVLVQQGSNPIGWMKMPFALTKAYRSYRQYRKSLGK